MAGLQGAKVSIKDSGTGQTIEYEMVRVGTMVQYREAVKAVEALTSRANKAELRVEQFRKRTIAAEAEAGILRGDMEVAASKIAGLEDTAQALEAKVQASDANALDADRAHAERADVANDLLCERDEARACLAEMTRQRDTALATLNGAQAGLSKAQAKFEKTEEQRAAERHVRHSRAGKVKEVRTRLTGLADLLGELEGMV